MRSSNISKALRTSSAGETTAAVMRGWKSSVHRSPITPISEKSRGTRTWAPSSARDTPRSALSLMVTAAVIRGRVPRICFMQASPLAGSSGQQIG